MASPRVRRSTNLACIVVGARLAPYTRDAIMSEQPQSRWTDRARALLSTPGVYFVGRHLGHPTAFGGSEHWLDLRSTVASYAEAERLLQTESGYGAASVLELVAIVDRPWPSRDGRGLDWNLLRKGRIALAQPSVDWPREMRDRETGLLGLRALDIQDDLAPLEARARKQRERVLLLRSWGTIDTDAREWIG
jgi:hypothetical protein